MSEETNQREDRTARLVDEPAEQVDGLEQGRHERVSDRDDGSPDLRTVDSDDSDTLLDKDDMTSDSDARDPVAGAGYDRADELMPGELTDAPVGSLWSSETAGGLRDRW